MRNLALQPLKTSNLRYHNAYNHQTGQRGGLPGEDLTYKIASLFDHVVLQYHVTN